MIEKRPFGRTGHLSTRTIFGAAAFGKVRQEEADQTMELLLEYGINHIDTAASYGEAEDRLGPWMETHRDQFFLATKTVERTYQKAKDEIHRSLERMRVEQIDLIQLHNLVDETEWQTAFAPGGVLEAAIEAREAGIVRFIGVTGHGLTVARQHLRSLERFDFDSVLLPCNYAMMQDPAYAADFNALRAVCHERNIPMQTIKSVLRRPWGVKEQYRYTWYEPFEEQPALDHAVHWLLGQPDLFLNTAGDIHVLPPVLESASRFTAPPTDAEMQEMLATQDMAPLFVS